MTVPSFAVREYPPREVARVQVNKFADMHNPERPFQVVLWEPDSNVLDDETPHAIRDLNRSELAALGRAIFDLLEAADRYENANVFSATQKAGEPQ